ncbi:double-strand break repair protein AddB [Rhodovulum sp. DZ06]|uniref:double-strand break repair protein AddB n=1 Tax=Rhodovulum sp. DZ06 TaxID=3425126 RepID=UPI003D351E05
MSDPLDDPFGAGPSVFYLPPGADFPAAFAEGLAARAEALGPLALPRATVVANARRTARAIEAAFEARASATWLPRFELIANIGETACPPDLPPGADPLRRRLALLRLVEALLEAAPDFGPLSAAPALATSLARLLDDLQGSARSAEDLAALEMGDHAAHWAQTRRFLEVLTAHWPAWLEDEGAMDPQARRLAGAEALHAALQAMPPAGLLVGAGSTGSTPATAAALSAIAHAPMGAVVLPGFDPDCPADVAAALADPATRPPEHPQAALHALLARIGVAPGAVRPWVEGAAAPCAARLRLVSEAMRPAPVTDRWREAAPVLRPEAIPATEDLALVEAANEREEAATVALLLAEAARGDKTAALITPDRNLARRVTAELRRWGVLPDDSAGMPLTLTPPGLLLGLIADGMGRPMTAPRLFAILRHPLVGGDGDRRPGHLRALRLLERAALRGGGAEVDWDRLAPAMEAEAERKAEKLAARRGWTEEAKADRIAAIRAQHVAACTWLDAVRGALAPLSAPPPGLGAAAALHMGAAETLSGALPGTAADGPLGDGPALLEKGDAPEDRPAEEDADLLPIWRKAAGADARAFMEALAAAAPAHDETAGAPSRPMAAYAALWSGLAAERNARAEAQRAHDRIMILGTLEARAVRPDLAILGGLNEGVWPAPPEADPWLTRDARDALGLPKRETRIGLAAHDFLLAVNAPRAVMTRARKTEGSPAVASRWLIRLENLLLGVDEDALKAMRARGDAALARARALDWAAPVPAEPRPAPAPAAEARPRELPVTAIETLIRDPYAVYARYVLNLRALEPIGRAPDARDMGDALHKVMERFAALAAGIGDDAPALRAALLSAADDILPETAPNAALARIWSMRLARTADWFAAEEAGRRRDGVPRIIAETRGARRLHAPHGPFTLTARADRIDLRADGRLGLYDYKSGKPPSPSEQTAFAKQLTLSASIARAGGFKAAGPGEVAEAVYLGLTGDPEKGGAAVRAASDPEQLESEWDRLKTLVAHYDSGAAPYPARLRPKRLGYASDYDHLSRLGEWSDGQEGEE